MKCTLIITTKNEERSIRALLDSIAAQTRPPDEVVIADAGSTDQTRKIIDTYAKKLHIKLINLSPNANRAIGRNRAIKAATHDIVLITDAGCVLSPSWINEMCLPFIKQDADVVAGYYRGEGKNIFERCQIPYVLVMPDRYDPQSFLPATRSMGMRKSVWLSMGGFDEKLRFAEDYIFARKLREKKYLIISAPKAIVTWRARGTMESFARMIYEHAQGDAYSRAWRPKVALIFIRYGILVVFPFLLLPYLLYAIWKNYRYVNDPKAIFYLPLLQVTSDLAVMAGTLVGLAKRFHLLMMLQ